MKKRILRCALALLLACILFVQPIFAAGTDPDVILAYKSHCDIGFTDLVSRVIHEYRTTFTDNALENIDEIKEKFGDEQQFKWILPGWPLAQMLEDWDGQTETRKARLEAAVSEGLIVPHAFADTPLTDALDLEDLVRLMSWSSEIAREYGLELPKSIKLTDVPGHSWVLPTLLANAGVNFIHMGSNSGCPYPNLPSLFWWEGIDGSKVLVMRSLNYSHYNDVPSDWPEDVDVWLDFEMGRDNDPPPTAEKVQQDIEKFIEHGQTVEIGTMDDFADIVIKHVENGTINSIPTYAVDMPDSWTYGMMASPTETKMNRQHRMKTFELEFLSTMLSVWGVDAPDTAYLVNSAVENSMLYNEHNWGMNHELTDYGTAFRQNLAAGAYDYKIASWREHAGFEEAVEDAIIPALTQNAELLAQAVEADGARIVVFNGLAWDRDGVVTAEIPGKAPAYLKNLDTEQIVPVSVSGNEITFTAHDVPAMGYATYVYCEAEEQNNGISYDSTSNVIENEYYKVTFDPATGSISSILDKNDENRELVSNTSDYGFSQYFNERFSAEDVKSYTDIYIKGSTNIKDFGKAGLVNSDTYKNYPYVKDVPQDLNISYEMNEGTITATMTAGASHPAADANGVAGNTYDEMSIKVTLYADQPYIDITWSMDGKVADPWPMADWLSFSFNVDNPTYRLYRVGGVIDPDEDVVENSAVNNWCLDGGMAIVDSATKKGVALCSADSPNLSIGKPGIFQYDKGIVAESDGGNGTNAFYPAEPTVFLNLFNNAWDTAFCLFNGGDWNTSVRLWSINDTYDEEQDLVTPSREVRLPMTAVYADNTDGTMAATKRGLELSASGVHVTAFGPNIDGNGTILRLWEQGGNDVTCTVTLPEEMNAQTVQPVDLRGEVIGEPIAVVNNQFTVKIGHNAPYTVLIDYERTESEKYISPVHDLRAKRSTDGTSATLTWECESSNVSSFVVEHRVANGQWSIVKETAEKTVTLSIQLGTQQFRVKSVSSGAESEYVATDLFDWSENIISVASVSASSFNSNVTSPEHVVSGEGLSMNSSYGVHTNVVDSNMWRTVENPTSDVWIEFDFGETVNLGKTYIWNYNHLDSNYPTRKNAGLKYVKIMYTKDGTNWQQFTNDQCTKDEGYTDLFKFAIGTAKQSMEATNLDGGDVLNFEGLTASKIRFEVSNQVNVGNWGWYGGNRNVFGLSEVMFMSANEGQIDPSAAVLENLEIEGIPLTPVFSSTGYTYEAKVPAITENLTVNVVPENPNATVKVNGIEVTDGTATLSAENLNSLVVKVVSADEKVNAQYAVKLSYDSGVITPVAVSAGAEPEKSSCPAANTINGSGFTLSGDNLAEATHVNGGTETLWGTKSDGDYAKGWIQFDLGAPYGLDEMWVWNFNQYNKDYTDESSSKKPLVNRGMKNVIITYSLNGTTWYTLTTEQANGDEPADNDTNTWFKLAKAPGTTGMKASNLDGTNEPIKFNGVTARYVRITPAGDVNDGNYGGYSGRELYFGLSEVRFTGEGRATYAVSGTVSAGETGADVGGLTVGLYDANDEQFMMPFVETTTDATGTYAFENGVASGNYVAAVKAVSGKHGLSTANVTVGDQAVTNVDITLTECLDQRAADAVIEEIGAIGEVTLESETVITEARTAYDALTPAQKALVTNYSALTAAEAAYKTLADADEAADVALAEAIAGAEKLTDADYTAETWAAVADALANAKALGEDASTADKNEAAEALTDAIAALEKAEKPETKVEINEDGIAEVPDTLAEKYETVEELEEAIVQVMVDENNKISEDNVAHYDVTLMYSEDGGKTWYKADEEHFPENGKLKVTLPYPDGTDKSYIFVVAHMFTSNAFGKTPGKVEMPVVTNTDNGIVFEVTGLSPISVGWTAPVTDEPERPSWPIYPIRPIWPVVGGAAETPEKFPFVDVPANAWFYDEVKEAWENDLIDGMTATEYKPDNTLTVAQAIKLASALHQMHFNGKVTLENGAINWYDSYVDYAIYNGIIDAKYDRYTNAQMNAAISREEFVHIFFGAMSEENYYACNYVADNAIPDVKMDDAFASEIYTFYRAGILTGSDAQGTFNPDSNIKRSEVAAILIRMYDTDARQAVTLG